MYLWSIRLGLIVFILGSLQGGMLSCYSSHTLGRADVGSGLPFVNWSTKAGDLRIAHMLGIHALQVIPFAGYLVIRWMKYRPLPRQMSYLVAFTILYVGLTLAVLVQAMARQPRIALADRPPEDPAATTTAVFSR